MILIAMVLWRPTNFGERVQMPRLHESPFPPAGNVKKRLPCSGTTVPVRGMENSLGLLGAVTKKETPAGNACNKLRGKVLHTAS